MRFWRDIFMRSGASVRIRAFLGRSTSLTSSPRSGRSWILVLCVSRAVASFLQVMEPRYRG